MRGHDKMIDGKQMMLCWHVNDTSHCDTKKVDGMIKWLCMNIYLRMEVVP
jgi:hypothetical protein